jgi:phospholipase C
MTDKPAVPPDEAPLSPERRRLLGGIALAGAALALGNGRAFGERASASGASEPSAAALDALLRRHIQQVVVLYAENRSFNNLFANFPGLAQPLQSLDSPDYRQRDRDGSELATLPPIWGGLAPRAQTVNGRHYQIEEGAISGLPNRPFALRTPDGAPLPHGVITRDLVHRFYENQLQINGGRNDGFVAWSNTGAMVMGHYPDGAANLRLWKLAETFTLCDNFFMGAFGGSFLNHQYLAAAQPPFHPHADQGPAKIQIATEEGDDPAGIRPKLAGDSPASAMQGRAKFATRDALTPDFWAVNTMGPAYAPAFSRDKLDPRFADTDSPDTLPPQTHATIGDLLSDAGIDWAWYAGGWQLALTAMATAITRRFRKCRISRSTTSPSTTSATSRPARRRAGSTCATPASAAAPTPTTSSQRSKPARCRRCRSTNRRAISTCMRATPAWPRATSTWRRWSRRCRPARSGRTCWC